jgi:CubicO group peptidase (beta-lactamase class C family)
MQGFRSSTIACALLAILCAAQGCSDASAPTCDPVAGAGDATTVAITATVERIKAEDALGAVVFAVERDGVPTLRTALGDSTPGVPATTDMHFRIGGVGWQFLTTILLRMVENDPGRISLTDLAAQWYPAYPHADRATVRMLAASSAGFGDYIMPQSFIDDVTADPLRLWTADDLIARSVPPYQVPQFDDPGGNWAYSHTDFVMLGAILEQVSGSDYAALLQELILDPLGLRNTRFQLDADPQQPVLHTLTEETFDDSTYWNPSFVSWAALTSNVCDLATWNRAFGTGALLSPESRHEITAPVNVGLGGNTPQHYFGLGTVVFTPWIVQQAAYWGMYTTTAYDPTTGFSIQATASLTSDSPAGISPADEIVFAVSKLLTPDHPIR